MRKLATKAAVVLTGTLLSIGVVVPVANAYDTNWPCPHCAHVSVR